MITGAEPGGPELVDEITLAADGDQTILVIKQRGTPLEQVAGWGAGNQIHAENLAAYLAGGERCDSDARIEELFPAYKALPVEGA